MSLVVVVLNLNTSKRNGGGPPVMVLPNAVIPLSDLHGCYSVTTLAQFWPMIPPLLFESVLCFFMAYKAWCVYREDRKNPLIMLLIRDRYVVH